MSNERATCPETVEVEASRLLELPYDWRAIHHATTGVSHAFALAGFTNTIYPLGNGVAEGTGSMRTNTSSLTHQPPKAHGEKES